MVSRSTRTCGLCISHLDLKKAGEGEDDGGKQPGMKKRNGEQQKQEESSKMIEWLVLIYIMSDLYLMTPNPNMCF